MQSLVERRALAPALARHACVCVCVRGRARAPASGPGPAGAAAPRFGRLKQGARGACAARVIAPKLAPPSPITARAGRAEAPAPCCDLGPFFEKSKELWA